MKLSRRNLLTGVAAVALGHRVPEPVGFTLADVQAAVELLSESNIPGPCYLTPHIGNLVEVLFFLNE